MKKNKGKSKVQQPTRVFLKDESSHLIKEYESIILEYMVCKKQSCFP